MTVSGIVFIILLLFNMLITIGYLLWFLKWKKDTDNRRQYVMHAVVMIICPFVGIMYFVIGFLKFRYIEFGERDLSDVEFSKKRHVARVKADENRERNVVSIGEAIVVSDREKKRANMLNVLLGETEESFSSIALALDSDDSEVAHYAASFLQNRMDKFRENVQRMQMTIAESDVGEEDCQKQIVKLIYYMNHILKQKVFTQVEQVDYVEQMEQLCETLYQEARYVMQPDCYEMLMERLMELNRYDRAEIWGIRFSMRYPDRMPAYTLRMKLYFETGRNDKFFEVLDQLKASAIAIDNNTLELIRMIQG